MRTCACVRIDTHTQGPRIMNIQFFMKQIVKVNRSHILKIYRI
jgi:hypothetical protein